MTISEAAHFFKDSAIREKLEVLSAVGLDYLEIGQALSTLSGGEAQRIKLASELHKKSRCHVMDEPTTGLHLADVQKLIKIIDELTGNNNSVIAIEHNLDIISRADWIIALGPEGGKNGGEVIFEGTPEELINCQRSHTGVYLKEYTRRTH
jgi:excinuclease UvrABC ATPase subunit